MSDNESAIDRELIRQRARRKLSKIAVGFLGVIVGIVGGVTVWVLIHCGTTPEITWQTLEEAERCWEAAAPADYDVKVEVFGRQAATYSLEVRDGQVKAFFRNGYAIKGRRVVDTWTVEGMFSTIKRDLERNDQVASGNAPRGIQRLELRGTFDSTYGYPQQYHRIPLGDEPDVAWQVKSFHVVQ